MNTEIPALPIWLDVAAMMTVAAYAAAVARSRNAPIYGTLLSGTLVGLGGGMTRDVLLGLEPVAISEWFYIPAILLAALFGALLFYKLVSQQVPNLLISGIAMGLLISIGAQKAMVHGAPFFSIILCGVFTASVGGMMVEVLTKHRATVVSQAHWFGTALTVGALCYWAVSLYINPYLGVATAIIVTALLRVLSVTQNWPSPKWSGEGDDMNV